MDVAEFKTELRRQCELEIASTEGTLRDVGERIRRDGIFQGNCERRLTMLKERLAFIDGLTWVTARCGAMPEERQPGQEG